MTKSIVILNSKSGRPSLNEPRITEVRNHLASAGIDTVIREVSGANIASESVRAAKSDVELVIAAGGDGTISAVAGQLAGTGKVLGVLPLGTLNHFARDLGIPSSIADASSVIGAGQVETIDVAEVNGRVFINNSSVGLYPAMVLRRDAESKARGWTKWPSAIFAMVQVAIRFPLIDIRLEVDQSQFARKTPIAFVGNNRYLLESSDIGKRQSLCDGNLSLYVARPTSRFRLILSLFKTLLGRNDSESDLESFDLEACRMDFKRRRKVHVAIDGEVVRMRSPLEYRIRRGDLRVCVPKPQQLPVEAQSGALEIGCPPSSVSSV